MDWITTDEFKANFAVAKNANQAQAQMAIDAAVDELVEYVGQSAVTDTLLPSPVDAARAAKLVRGHKFLAAAIIAVNVKNVKQEQDAGSPAAAGKFVINQYWTPAEIQQIAGQWREMALRALANYLIVDANGDNYSASPEFINPTIGPCPDVCTNTSFVEEVCCK